MSRVEKESTERSVDLSRQTKPESIANILKRRAPDDDDFDTVWFFFVQSSYKYAQYLV